MTTVRLTVAQALLQAEPGAVTLAPSSQSWWDVPVSEASALESTQRARAAYEAARRDQKLYL